MSGDPYDRYFYEGGDTLINSFGIRDPAELHLVEYRESKLATPEALEFARSETVFTPRSLQGVHRILFGRLYPWAGEWRTMALHKQATTFRREVSETRMAAAMDRFQAEGLAKADLLGPFAGELGRLWGDLNFEHPFVEGNGRATQVLLTAAAERLGWSIDWAKVNQADELDAAIRSCMPALGDRRFNGYHDLLIRVIDRHQRGDPSENLKRN